MAAGKPADAVNRLFDPSTFRKVFGGNDCQQQPDTIITKCRGSKDHEYWCASLEYARQGFLMAATCVHTPAFIHWHLALLRGKRQHLREANWEGRWLCLSCPCVHEVLQVSMSAAKSDHSDVPWDACLMCTPFFFCQVGVNLLTCISALCAAAPGSAPRPSLARRAVSVWLQAAGTVACAGMLLSSWRCNLGPAFGCAAMGAGAAGSNC